MPQALLPVRTASPNGSHGHWRVLAKRRKFERAQARMLCPKVVLPCVVRLTRLSAGKLDDDNVRFALKAVRDGCADALGVKDNDPRVTWEYAQEPIKRGGYGVIVTVTPA
jgi:hypothetical protein